MCDEVSLDGGELLFEAGEVGDSLFVVVAGSVDVIRGGSLIARLGPRSRPTWCASSGTI
jgi:CRP-like cAMP-binding protein